MTLIRVPKPWQVERQPITSPTAYFNRRRFIKGAISAGIGAATLPLLGCQRQVSETDSTFQKTIQQRPSLQPVSTNPNFADPGRPVTEQVYASAYNNFYEFGSSKQIWRKAQDLPLEDWKVDVTGLVNNPKTYDKDDLIQAFDLEERIYRFRCVEAWAMVVPWVGFPMRSLLEAADPKSNAKYVRFTSYYDPAVSTGPAWPPSAYMPWPYTEGLRLEEMANDLAFFAVGIYGRELPKQHGAPIRMVVPWKYGFKGAKSIVKIEFIEDQPATFWHTEVPNEYGFEANVNPTVPHPRWSQAEERMVGTGANPYLWEKRPTLLYNGYEEYVADLYA
jgi:sulfoxide reductase catalytic subunit YedY